MKRKRRTSEEVTNDMFNERERSGDLVVIAYDDENSSYWCQCGGRCRCGKPEKDFFANQEVIYRSIRKPSLCFYYVWYCGGHPNSRYSLQRFDHQHLAHFLQPSMTINQQEYNAFARKRKVKKVLAS